MEPLVVLLSNVEISNMKLTDDLAEIILLRDKIFKIYTTHLKNSTTINNTKKRLINKNFIDPYRNEIDLIDFLNAFAEVISLFSQWLIYYIKQLPGFEHFVFDDLRELIKKGYLFNIFTHHNESIMKRMVIYLH